LISGVAHAETLMGAGSTFKSQPESM
jgi:hypothetical protein